MNGKTRIRLLWGIVTAALVYGLTIVTVYLLTREFNLAWLLVSLGLYAVMLGMVLTLAFTDGPAPADRAPQPPSRPVTVVLRHEPRRKAIPRIRHEVVYRTRSGEAIKATYGTPSHMRSDYFLVGRQTALPVRGVEARLDNYREVAPVGDVSAEVDAALKRRETAAYAGPALLPRNKKVTA